MSHDVFLSHASSDRHAAEQICAALEMRGIRCWIAPRNVLPGEDWSMAILAAIAAARCMVVVISVATHDSIHVRNEVVTANTQRLPLVPVRVANVQPGGALRLHLAAWHWLDAFPPPIEPHANALAAGIRAAFSDSDATVNMMVRRPPAAMMPPGPPPAAAPAGAAAPPVQAGVKPASVSSGSPMRKSAPGPANSVAPGQAARGRGPALALIAIGGALLILVAVLGWLFTFGPGRDWAFGPAPGPSLAGAAAGGAGEAPRSPVLPIVASPASPTAPPAAPPGAAPAPSPPPAPPVDPRPVTPVVTPAPPGVPTPQPRPLDEVAPRPPARPAMITVINTGTQDIDALFVSPVSENRWGEDWLGLAQITPGNRVLVPRAVEAGCLHDLRIIYRDRRAEELRRQDLCAVTEFRFDGSKARAAATAPR